MNKKDNIQSEFNSSLDVLTRINLLFHQANINSYSGDYNNWARSLTILYRELERFIPEKERQPVRKDLVKIFEATLNLGQNNKYISKELYWDMDKIDSYLRNIFHASGLGIKTKEAEDDWNF